MAFKIGDIVAVIKADTTQFKQGIKDVGKETKNFKSNVVDLKSMATKAGAALGIAFGASAVIGYLKNAAAASVELENSLTGLSSIAEKLGVDVDDATRAAQDLASDGLMSVREAAEGLKNLLATGFSLPEAINLMNGFKDAAAFNRQGTLEFGQAIVGATQGLKNQNSIMVDNVGITKNLSNIIKEQGGNISDLSEITSNATARQRIYNGLMKEASLFQGDAAKAANTLGGRMSQLKTAQFNLSAAIGDVLAPSIMMVAEAMTGSLNGAMQWVKAHSVELKAYIMALTGAFMILGQVIGMIGSAMINVLKGDFTAAVGSVSIGIEKIKNRFTTTQQKIQDMATKSYGRIEKAGTGAINNIADTQSKASKKMQKELEDETRKFEKEMDKRKRSFEQSLADLIWAHLDKKKQLEEDIAEENKDFEERMTDRKAGFAEDMDDMKADHAEKVADIQAQIDEETAKGEEADQARVLSLQNALIAENAAYDEAVAKKTAAFEKETLKLQEEHDKRIKSYEEELSQEKAILEKHKGDVAKVKDKEREDDITRLKRQYEEENQLAAEEHERRLKEIQERGTELGDNLGGAIDTALGARLEDIDNTMQDIVDTSGDTLTTGMDTNARTAGSNLINGLLDAIWEKAKDAAKWLEEKGLTKKGSSTLFSIFGDIVKTQLPRFDEGGVVGGKLGQPQLAIVEGGETILPTHKKGMAGVTQNINVYPSDELDVDTIADRLAFKYRSSL